MSSLQLIESIILEFDWISVEQQVQQSIPKFLIAKSIDLTRFTKSIEMEIWRTVQILCHVFVSKGC